MFVDAAIDTCTTHTLIMDPNRMLLALSLFMGKNSKITQCRAATVNQNQLNLRFVEFILCALCIACHRGRLPNSLIHTYMKRVCMREKKTQECHVHFAHMSEEQ